MKGIKGKGRGFNNKMKGIKVKRRGEY